MHDSLTIALLQAREAAMSYFRPIVKRHNLTEQQWRIMHILAESPSIDFTIWRIAPAFCAPKPDRDPHADGTRRFSVAIKADQ